MSASKSHYILVQFETLLIKRSVVNVLRFKYQTFFCQHIFLNQHLRLTGF